MANFTTRLGLTKPTGAEARSVTPLNANADSIDKFLPCILVNDGVTPPTGDLYDGALVKERNSGIIWEARKNGGGTYDKVYVRYPYVFSGSNTTVPISRGSNVWPNFVDSGYDTVIAALCKNSSAAHISSAGWKVPIKGIYQLHMRTAWDPNVTGIRGMCLRINGTNQINTPTTNNTTKEVPPTPGGTSNTVVDFNIPYLLNANDIITAGVYQNSGGSLNQQQSFIHAAMIEPVQ